MITARLADLRQAVTWVTASAEPAGVLRLALEGQVLRLECGPYGHRRWLETEAHGEPAEFHVPARVFADWLATQASPDVVLEGTAEALVVTAKGRCRFPLVEADGLRLPPGDRVTWDLDSEELAASVDAVAGHGPARGERLREWEGFVRVEPGRVMAGSPYSAGVAVLSGPQKLGPAFSIAVDVQALQSALKGRAGPVTVEEGTVARLTWPDRSVALAVAAKEVPDFSVLMKDRDVSATVSAPELRAAVRAATVDSDRVRLIFGDDGFLTVRSVLGSKGVVLSGDATTQVEYTNGEPWQVTLNAAYLSVAAGSVTGELTISWNRTGRHSVLVTTDGVVHAVQPIREGERQ